MRTLQIIAALGSVAAMLCACDGANEQSVGADPNAIYTVALPPGFSQTLDESAPTEFGELDIAGRFIVENRRGEPLKATLLLRDWGAGLDEVEGEKVEVTIPARGRVASDWIGRRARAVSMRLEGAGMLSQTHHGFEYMGARVVVDHGPSPLPRVRGEIFTPALEDQLPGSLQFVVDPSEPAAPATLRIGDFFRLVNETGVAMPAELRFERTRDDGGSTMTMLVVIPAHGECDVEALERYDSVTITMPGRPLYADSVSKGRISVGPVRIRDGRVIEYRVTENGAGGTVIERKESLD